MARFVVLSANFHDANTLSFPAARETCSWKELLALSQEVNNSWPISLFHFDALL
jgi:hypothetical protein